MQTNNHELYHHGVKGMKWGVRRTPAQLGYKVSTYKKKAAQLSSKVSAYRKKRRQEKEEKIKAKEAAHPKRKSASEMTDEELINAINRARMEDTYNSLRPEQVSKGRQFVDTAFNKVIAPAAVESGKRALTNYLNKLTDDALKDVKPEDAISRLTRKRDELKLKNEIEDLKNPKKSSEPEVKNWKDMLDKQKYDAANKQEAEADAKKKAKADADKAKADAEKKAKEAALADAQKQVNDYLEKLRTQNDGVYSKKGKDLEYSKDVVDSGKKTIAGLLPGPVANTSVNSSTAAGFARSGAEATDQVLDTNGNLLVTKYD